MISFEEKKMKGVFKLFIRSLFFSILILSLNSYGEDIVWSNEKITEDYFKCDSGDGLVIKGDVILEHPLERVFDEDYRPLKAKKIVEIQCENIYFEEDSTLQTFSKLKLMVRHELSGDVKIIGQRGKGFDAPHSKGHGLNGSRGHIGRHGPKGRNGDCGAFGIGCDHPTTGDNGEHGFLGHEGTEGQEGQNGYEGSHAPDIVILAEHFSPDTKLLIKSVGGIGGQGGQGGHGGHGGIGGAGGSGGNGGGGHEWRRGTNGGHGGDGGNGGRGGRGGNGGTGGTGGNGGKIRVYKFGKESKTPNDFNYDASGGEGGKPGLGGIRGLGGKGGDGGLGGKAGSDWCGIIHCQGGGSRGWDGIPGRPGENGFDGLSGQYGAVGQDGRLEEANWGTVNIDPDDLFKSEMDFNELLDLETTNW